MIKTTTMLRRSLLAILCGIVVTATGVAPQASITADAAPTEETPDAGDDGDEAPEGAKDYAASNYRYAVRIIGIGVDTMIDGSTGGLTFGPALGADYTNGYNSHTPTGTTRRGNAHRCVHADSWEQIADYGWEDPEIYEQCLAEGCTKVVPLRLQADENAYDGENSQYVFNLATANQYTGENVDGVSTLYYELQPMAREYADEPHDTSHEEHGASLTWANSLVRSMLNGTQYSYAEGDYHYLADQYNYNEDEHTGNCLLAAFPAELQDAIGYRKVTTAATYDVNHLSYQGTPDKLWLLSNMELFGNEGNSLASYMSGKAAYLGEGTQYSLHKALGISLQNTTNASAVAYKSTGVKGSYWTISRFYAASSSEYVSTVTTLGRLGNSDMNYSTVGVSPCFTLNCRQQEPENPSTPAETPSAGDAHDANAGVGSVSLYNTDTAMAQYLSGAKFALYKSNGDYVGTYTMDANGYLNIKSLDASTYYFVQLTAPEGYVLDPTYLRFELKGDQAINLVFKNALIGTVDANADGTLADTAASPNADGSQAVADGADADASFSVNSDGTNAGDENGSAIDATGDDSLMMDYGIVAGAAAVLLLGWYGMRRRQSGQI